IYDLMDVHERATKWMSARAWRLLVEIAEAAIIATLSLAMTQLVVLLLLLTCYSYKRHPYGTRAKARPVWVRIILFAAVIKGTHAGYGDEVKPKLSPMGIPLPTDLELWMSGQATMREQLAAAFERHVATMPLEHNSEVAPPPDFTVPIPEAPPPPPPQLQPHEHWINREEPATTHISFWICAPYYESMSLDVAMSFPLTINRVFEAIQNSAIDMPTDILDHPVAVTPQPDEAFGSVLMIPTWIRMSGKTAVVLDGRHVGAGIFAAYFEGPLTRRGLLQKIGMGPDAGISIFLFGSLQPMNDEQREPPSQGGLILFLRRGEVPEWATELDTRLTDTTRWRPDVDHPQHLPGRHIEFQGEEQTFLHLLDRTVPPDPQRMADHAFGASQGDVWIRAPTQRPMRMYARGKRVHSIIAVLGAGRYPRDTTKVVFLDTRPIGLWPQWVAIPGDFLDPGAYAEGLQIPYIEGYSLVIKGGRRHRDGVRIRVLDGEVIELLLRRTDEERALLDRLPLDRSMKTEVALLGEKGRKMAAKMSALKLADHVAPYVPHFDLTEQCLRLPHKGYDLQALTTPWGTGWLSWSFDGVNVKQATKDAMQDAPNWPDLFRRAGPTDSIEFHVYTDGSANGRQDRSGYGVVVLLKVGVAYALLGLFGGQLLGNPDNVWPLQEPAALRGEQVALAAALLWALQFSHVLQHATCHIHYDCTAAGKAATGDWQHPDFFSEKIHHLELFSRDCIAGGIQMSHVAAHNGDPWNELADEIAKAAAAKRGAIWQPPHNAIETFLNTDISWLAAAHHATIHGTLPIYDDELRWSPENPPFEETTPLKPSQIVPTVSEAWGQGKDPHDFSLTVATLNSQGMAGKHRYYEEQLDELKCNIFFVQEHKGDSSVCLSKRYTRLHTAGNKHWGVGVWISKNYGILSIDGKPLKADLADISIPYEDERLLIATVLLGGAKVVLVSAHCPHAAKQQEAEDFLANLETQLRAVLPAHMIIVGTDLNGRLPCPFGRVTGDLSDGHPDLIGAKAASICQEFALWAPATYHSLHKGPTATYRHPMGGEHRIDYILIGGRAQCHQVRSEISKTFDTMNANDDHSLSVVHMVGTWKHQGRRARLWRPRYDTVKLRSSAGKQLVALEMGKYIPPPWNVHPDAHCQHLQDHLNGILHRHFQKPANAPQASYIPEFIWDIRLQKLRLKKEATPRRQIWHRPIKAAYEAWRSGHPLAVPPASKKEILLHGIVALAIKFATYRIKIGIRRAKSDFLKQMAKGPEPTTGASHMLGNLRRAGVGKSAHKPYQKQLPLLLDDQNQPTASKEDRDMVWLKHFGAQECGQILPVHTLAETPHPKIVQDRELEWTMGSLPSIDELEKAYRRAPFNKSAGLDGIPGELLKAAPAALARNSHALMTKTVLTLQQPLQWRGGVLYSAWKRAGNPAMAESHRSLFISSLLGKSLHRLMKDKVAHNIENSLHPLHMGSRRGAPVTYPAMAILSHLRGTIRRKQSAAILFLDTKAAYYMVAREMAVGKIYDDQTIAHVFRRFQLDPEDIHELYKAIAEGGVMADFDMDPVVRHVAKDYHHRAWFTSHYGDGSRICMTRAGSRPGESWADCIFAAVYSRVLYRVAEMAQAEELIDPHCFDPTLGIFAQGDGHERVWINDSTWADDSAFPLKDASPVALLKKASRLSSLVLSRCYELGMVPNLKPGKTSLLLRIAGKGSAAAKRLFFPEGKPQIYLSDLQVNIATAPVYTHLGGVLDHRGSMLPETRRRLAIASTSLDEGKVLVYGNKTIDLPARVAVFEAAVRPTLFNLSLWLIRGPAWTKLELGYARLLRRLLATHFQGEALFKLPSQLVYALTDSLPLHMVARKMRFALLCSMALTGPPGLWAMLQWEMEWCEQMQRDLEWLYAGDSAHWPQPCGASWPEWWRLLRCSTKRVKARVQKQLDTDFATYCSYHLRKLGLWALYRQAARALPGIPVQRTWCCRPCGKSFAKKAQLAVHFFKVHARRASHRLNVEGTVCRACGRQYWSANRLMIHLRDSATCVATLRGLGHHNEEPCPGMGSKRWKQRDVDQYTPALPKQVQEGVSATGGEVWDRTQKEAHRALSDALLVSDLPSQTATVQDSIGKILGSFPLYEQEEQDIAGAVYQEAREIVAADLNDYWSRPQLEAMQTALQAFMSGTCPSTPGAQTIVQDQFSYDDFLEKEDAIDWGRLRASLQSPHETKTETVVILVGPLEAVWSPGRDFLRNTAVKAFPEALLPQSIRRAWDTITTGGSVQVLAPPAFWGSYLAKPFSPLAACQKQRSRERRQSAESNYILIPTQCIPSPTLILITEAAADHVQHPLLRKKGAGASKVVL
ncbi:Pol, partial [Symbiodinium sp. CCMP2456]